MSRSPLLVAGALEPSDKMAGPLIAGHRYLFPRLEPSFEAAGPACRLMPIAILARDALTKAGGTWLARLVPGDPLTSRGQDPLSKIRVPVPAGPFGWLAGDTPGQVLGMRRSCRYGWSWPEPPAGATPHQRREPPSPG